MQQLSLDIKFDIVADIDQLDDVAAGVQSYVDTGLAEDAGISILSTNNL